MMRQKSSSEVVPSDLLSGQSCIVHSESGCRPIPRCRLRASMSWFTIFRTPLSKLEWNSRIRSRSAPSSSSWLRIALPARAVTSTKSKSSSLSESGASTRCPRIVFPCLFESLSHRPAISTSCGRTLRTSLKPLPAPNSKIRISCTLQRLCFAHAAYSYYIDICENSQTQPMAQRPLPTDDLDHILTETTTLWEEMRDKHIFITGGTGFFGCWLLESFSYINRQLNLNASATILTRDPAAFAMKCPHLAADPTLAFLAGDVRSFSFPARDFPYILHPPNQD